MTELSSTPGRIRAETAALARAARLVAAADMSPVAFDVDIVLRAPAAGGGGSRRRDRHLMAHPPGVSIRCFNDSDKQGVSSK